MFSGINLAADERYQDPIIGSLFRVGAHFGYRRSKRHPTAVPFIFGAKGGVEIFDLEKSKQALLAAETFVKELAEAGKTILFVGGKREASPAVRDGAEKLGMPYIAGRWVGGTLTNFGQIRSRIDRMLDLVSKREKGELAKYTKKERLMIDREVARLEELFRGLVPLTGLPAALFVVDPGREYTAVGEARRKKMPVVALASSDCNLAEIHYPIPGNDSARASIAYVVERVVEAYASGKNEKLKAQSAK